MTRFRPERIFGSSILLGSLGMIILLTMIVQATYADNGIFVNASTQNKVISFDMSSGNDSPPIHGFIVTISNGHYSKITKSPNGWSAGIIKHQSVIWTTESYPVQPSSEGNFAIEVTQLGKYTISWSATDHKLQPVVWGTITITVT